jgi:hypothetical protein
VARRVLFVPLVRVVPGVGLPLGDLRVLGALETVEGGGLFAVPLAASAKEGDILHLEQPQQHGLQLGQPAELMLLKPLEKASTYRIERIIRFER